MGKEICNINQTIGMVMATIGIENFIQSKKEIYIGGSNLDKISIE